MKYFLNLLKYVLSGVLLGIGFLFTDLWFAGIIGAAYFLKIISESKQGIVVGCYTAWFVKFLFVLWSYWTIYPIRWLPLDFGGADLYLIGLYWLTVSAFLATGGLVFALLYKIVSGVFESNLWFRYLSIPIIWVVAEVGGSFLLSLIVLGPGSFLNAYFSLGYIGLLVAEHNQILQLSVLGGVYVLSLVAILSSVWLQKYLHKGVQLLIPAFFVVVLVGTAKLPLPEFTSSTTVSVAVVSTSFPVEDLFDRDKLPFLEEMQTTALESAVQTQTDYVLLPEDGRFLDQRDIEQAKNLFNFKYRESQSIIIDSSRVPYKDASVVQAIVFDAETNEHTLAHKKYLIPQGEFTPYLHTKLFRLIGFDSLMDELNRLLSNVVGPLTSQSEFRNEYPSILFCFESTSAVGVRELLKERPYTPFIVHPLSHSWFNNPWAFWSQLDASLKVQAVWNNVAIVSAANHGPSVLYLPNGKIVSPAKVAEGEFWEVAVIEVPIR